jgi:hypothetical protein
VYLKIQGAILGILCQLAVINCRAVMADDYWLLGYELLVAGLPALPAAGRLLVSGFRI